jgi:phosphate uptake regulator
METRKLQRVGGGTFTVSIPKGWAVDRDLGAGSEVYLFSHADGSIVVRGSNKETGALGEARIDIEKDDPDVIERVLRAGHVSGFERVILHSESGFTDGQTRRARSAKRHLVGLEIVAEENHEITFQNLLHAQEVSVRQSVVQIQFVALSVHRQAAAAFVDGEAIDLNQLKERMEEATRLSRMVTRHLNRSLISMAEIDHLGIGRSALFDYHVTAEALARITDEAVRVASAAEEISSRLPTGVSDDFNRASEVSRQALESSTAAVLEGGDLGMECEVFDRCDEAAEAIEAIHLKAFQSREDGFNPSPTDVRALTRALDAMTRIVEHTALIGEVALRASIRGTMGADLIRQR